MLDFIEEYDIARSFCLRYCPFPMRFIPSFSFPQTNAHVVSGRHEVEVKLSDGQRRYGNVLYIDAASDLAVVKISGVCTVLQKINPSHLPEFPSPDSLCVFRKICRS